MRIIRCGLFMLSMVALMLTGCRQKTANRIASLSIENKDILTALRIFEKAYSIRFEVKLSNAENVTRVTLALQNMKLCHSLSWLGEITGLNIVPLGNGVYHVDDVSCTDGATGSTLPFYKRRLEDY